MLAKKIGIKKWPGLITKCLISFYFFVQNGACFKTNFSSDTLFKASNNNRSSKLFPLVSIVRISNQPCAPDVGNSIGTCFTNNQCRNARGVVSGVCASGFGVCCVVTATCEAVVSQNNTNIQNKDFPNEFHPNGLEICKVRLQKPNPNVCQVRLDFTQFQLAPADPPFGHCMADRLTINGVSTQVPPNICGDLSGQHMYLDFGSSDRITLSVITDGGANTQSRIWNIRSTYIECNSIVRAPDGCLQYFMGATGEVRMLGYPMGPHLADLDYTVCVRSEDGAGAISWSPCRGEPLSLAFLMVGVPDEGGAAGAPVISCNDDYVLIMTDNSGKTDDRYCGAGFATAEAPHVVRSVAKPFIMRVKTDSIEGDADVMNTGFCLAFRQEPPRPAG